MKAHAWLFLALGKRGSVCGCERECVCVCLMKAHAWLFLALGKRDRGCVCL